ncbi:MAG: hypothetical protein ACJAS1_002426 [Oleiphilaceae bacterium]|jgi:hypothetical protein
MLTQRRYKREFNRYEVSLPLILESGNSRIIARSKNLSAGGASISLVDFVQSEDLDDKGSITIRAQSGEISTPYEITYRKENVIGIRFSDAKSLHSETLKHIFESASNNRMPPDPENVNFREAEEKHYISFKRRLWVLGRMASFLGINLLWPLLKHVVKPQVVFAVYGTRGDQKAYFPNWFKRICPPVVVAAYIKGKASHGVMISSVYSEEELASDSKKVRKYIGDMRKAFPKVKRFALVGRLPGFSMKAGIDITPPLVDGSLGTRFAMYESAIQIAGKLEDRSWAASIAILGGAGRIGSKLIDDLCKSFQTVIAIDPRYTEHHQELKGGSTVIYTKRSECLRETRLVLVLTAKGEDILPMVEYFEPGTIIADDTHPCIKRATRERLKKQGVDLWKTVVTSSDYGMYPRMPNFRNDNIPGCLLEALVLNAAGEHVLDSASKFFEEAKKCGYKTLLIRHPNDS